MDKQARLISVEGNPAGLTFSLVDQVARHYQGVGLQRVRHVCLSGTKGASTWKMDGVFRLLLDLESGKSWSIIYKKTRYQPDQIPGLSKLTVAARSPEFLIYKQDIEVLATYLPAIYLCHREIPGQDYQYLMEDLANEYQKVSTLSTIKQTVLNMPKLHQTLQIWSKSFSDLHLMHFDQNFSRIFEGYARQTLEYLARNRQPQAQEILKNWTKLAQLLTNPELHPVHMLRPIHGDFNRSNIFSHRQIPLKMKVFDWEWCGIGPPHLDLAALLRTVDISFENEALHCFIRQHPGLNDQEHTRIYRRCQLERGLLKLYYLRSQGLHRGSTLQLGETLRHVQAAYQALAA